MPSSQDLLSLLLGSTGALVFSLIANWLFWQGRLVNPAKTVPRSDYDAVKLETKKNTLALEKLTAAFVKLTKRSRAGAG